MLDNIYGINSYANITLWREETTKDLFGQNI